VSTRDLDQRIWRVRRRHDSIEAYLRPAGADWSLQFLRNGRVLFVLAFSSREDAAAVAAARLEELQRAGWSEHW